MSKKGFSTIELLVSFVIVSFVAIAMFKTVLELLDKAKYYQDQSKMTIVNGNVINSIQKDLNQKKLYGYSSCGCNCFDISYQDLSVKRLKIDLTANTIQYGGITEKLDNIHVIDGNMQLVKQTFPVGEDKNNTILRIYVPILNKTINSSSDINIVYQYDNSDFGNLAAYVEQPTGLTCEGVDIGIPIITMNGDKNININVGGTYGDAGATATDNVDGDVSSQIVATGTVNTNAAGTYTISYNVTDSAGNKAITLTRTVNVLYNFVAEGLIQWLDATEFKNTPQTTIWNDKSGNNNYAACYNFDYTMGSGSNGSGGVVFDGINDYIQSFTLTGNTTIVTCLTPKLKGSYHNVFDNLSDPMVWFRPTNQLEIDHAISLGPTIVDQKMSITSVITPTSNKTYVNGVLLSTDTIAHAFPYTITRFNRDGGQTFKGTIYHTLIYNRVLTDAEVLQNYNACK